MAVVLLASFPRILWLQWILADVGMEVFRDPKGMMDYFISHPLSLYYSAIYFLIVIVFAVVAFILKMVRKEPMILSLRARVT